MGNLMKTEWYKLRKDRVFQVLILLLLAISVAMPLSYFGKDFNLEKNVYYMGYVLSVNLEIVVRTIPVILAGFFISSEYSMGTMKSIVSSGNSRIRIYFTKLLMFSVGSIIISLILPFAMTGVSAIFLGSNVIPEGMYFLQTIGLISLYAVALASVIMFFAIIFTDSGKTIGFVIFFIVFFPSLLERLSDKLSFLQPFVDWSVFNLILNIYEIGQLDSSEVFKLVTAPIVTFIVVAVLGCIIFKKKEIK